MKTIHLLIKGKVQGVFYRATAKKVADQLGVNGWIKNTKERDVEVIATGNEEALTEFLNWCKQGPKDAKVTDVIITTKNPEAFNGFSIVR
jgi:acylphosphatase